MESNNRKIIRAAAAGIALLTVFATGLTTPTPARA